LLTRSFKVTHRSWDNSWYQNYWLRKPK